MAALMTSLKESWKTLVGGFALGAILGTGMAGYAVYLNQEPGRKALVAVAKANEEIAACATSLKEASDEAAKSRESSEKTATAKTELDVQLADAKAEIAKLTAAMQKAPARPGEKAATAKPEAKGPAPTYSNTLKKSGRDPSANRDRQGNREYEQSPQSNWEQGL